MIENNNCFAKAVTKLFEIRILGCAAGDFRRSPGPLMFYRHTRKQNIDIEIRCGCTGLAVRGEMIRKKKTFKNPSTFH